jgi:hypothetical protein
LTRRGPCHTPSDTSEGWSGLFEEPSGECPHAGRRAIISAPRLTIDRISWARRSQKVTGLATAS